MAFEITVPRLGWSMEEGTFVRWLKKDGDSVKPGEALFELEGEKAAQDIEAVDGGILRIPANSPAPGSTVAVGSIVGYLVAEGESLPTGGAVQRAPEPTGATAVAERPAGTSAVATVQELPPVAAPSVRRMAREMGVSLDRLVGSGPAGRITAADLGSGQHSREIAPAEGKSTVASPRARRVAKELGLDWSQIAGSGRDGRVRERDVRANADRGMRSGREATASPTITGRAIPLTRHRRTIADRMMSSQQNSAPVTLTTRVDATNLVSLRQQFKAAGGAVVPSYTDIVIKLVAMALADHPSVMMQWAGDQLVAPQEIGIGVAVDTESGLLVPVLRDVPALSLVDLSTESSRLIALARDGRLKAGDMQGSVFTVTNLGAYGIDAFTPIINSPESAILGMGRIRREPTVVDNQIVPRDQLSLSLTFDHRVVDGAPAARFLQTVSQAIETPSAWLLRNC